jgi:hypothetical protein
MEDFPMVNRCAVTLKPKAPFWQWVKSTDDTGEDMLKDAAKENNIYLIPDYENAADIYKSIESYVANNYKKLFTNELIGWWTDPDDFPELTYQRFKDWFEITVHTLIFDMVVSPIKKR